MEPRAVLHLTRNMFRKSGLSTTTAIRAEFHFSLILGNMETKFWQVMDLPGEIIMSSHGLPSDTTTAGIPSGESLASHQAHR